MCVQPNGVPYGARYKAIFNKGVFRICCLVTTSHRCKAFGDLCKSFAMKMRTCTALHCALKTQSHVELKF